MPLPPMPLKNIGESIMPAPLLAGWAGGKRRRFSSTRQARFVERGIAARKVRSSERNGNETRASK
jgi:hypothetical protein